MHKGVVVIIPVYNEGEVIADVVTAVTKRFSRVICIDDGSQDNSAEMIKSTSAQLVQHSINLGQGAALQTGIDYALLDPEIKYFVTYDADGQHDLNDVERMLTTIKQTKVDIILGSRFLGKAENITPLKRFVLKLAVLFSNKTSGITLTDAHNGLRVFNRRVAEELNITMPDFSHASEIVSRIAHKKFTYQEAPVTILYTDYSRKKGQSIFNAVNISFDIILRKVTK
jgi:glycosyltransferase involved in cell wall biosynthesis